MHQVEEHYYTINKIFLKVLGIWPHDKSRLVFLQRILIFTLTITYIILQLSVFITTKYNMVLFIKTMSLALPCIIITMKYCVCISKLETIKMLHHRIQEDWKLIRNKIENDIIQKHAHDSRNHTIFTFWCISVLLVTLIIIQFFPIILDYVSPLDKPRPCKLIITVEYFIIQENYFYTRVFHEFILVALCAVIISTIATQLLLFFYHSFGMFKIASHRLAHSIDDHVLYTPNYQQEREICKRIIHVVIAHRRAIEFSNIFMSILNVPYGGIAFIGVLSLSINLFRFVQAVTILKTMEDILISFFAIFGHLIYMFVATYVAQKSIDCSNEIFRLAYSISWYLMPVPSQKLILFLMTRTSKNLCITIGYIFVGKIENFATLVNTALSYVAVMYSVQ